MIPEIFFQLNPPQYQTVLSYSVLPGNLGVQGQLLVVNTGNPEVNSGNLALDQGRDTDFIRIAVSNSVVATDSCYLAYDTLMPPYHTAQWQEISLEQGDSIFVYNQKGQCSFTFTGLRFSA